MTTNSGITEIWVFGTIDTVPGQTVIILHLPYVENQIHGIILNVIVGLSIM